MDQIDARDKIDHYLNLLHRGDTSVDDRASINKLLVNELGQLNPGVAQLEFSESRAAKCRRRFDQIGHWRNGFADGSVERTQADKVTAQFELTLRMVESFCAQMREQLNVQSRQGSGFD
jgi:hypothetical protein